MKYKRKTSDILISNDLRKILKQIKQESLVARLLLRKRHKLETLSNNHVNYISTSKTEKGRISYLTQDRISSLDKSEYWESNRRYQAKPGAFISKVFKNIPPKEVEKFSSLFRTISIMPEFTFSVVKGNDIKKFYHVDSYSCESGSLGVSCMKYDNCQKLFDIYTKSKEVSMLVMLDNSGRLMGRALLWDIKPDKVMDRIYTIDDELLRFYFKKWATKNNYWYKSEQNWYNTLQFEQIGKEKREIKIEIKSEEFKYYPYMDTFKFINIDTNSLFNYIPENSNIKILISCDGSKYDGNYLKFDSISGFYRYSGECVYIDYLNIYTHENNAIWSRLNEKYILTGDSKYCDKLDDYIFKDDSKNKTLPEIKKKKKKMNQLFLDYSMEEGSYIIDTIINEVNTRNTYDITF